MADQESPSPSTPAENSEPAWRKLSLSDLLPEHRHPVERAIKNIMSTNIAEATYSQIVDGLPLADVVTSAYGDVLLDTDHPILQHKKLCPGALERTKSLRDSLDPGFLKFDSKLLYAYEAASPGSRSFNTRFIEVVAICVHQIAAHLFRTEPGFHGDDGIASWEPPKEEDFWWSFNPGGARPTLFNHDWYIDYKQNPEGVADMVGYWAENRILGGVVLFDRNTPDSDAVFFHPDRDTVTYRIFRLLDEQKRDFLNFLLSASPQSSCPLPILPNENNHERVDPEEPIDLTGIYRDEWERGLRPEYMGDERSTTVMDFLNYTSIRDKDDALGRFQTRIERYLSDRLPKENGEVNDTG